MSALSPGFSIPAVRPRLVERALGGIHAGVLRYVEQHVTPGTAVLDCGAGTGAWVDRLARHGYGPLYAIDRDGSCYGAEAPLAAIDLNTSFAAAAARAFGRDRFPLITAIEVVEHLENPSQFLRQCAELLEPAGTLLVSSPNPECTPARLTLLTSGRLRHFDHIGDPTHITPVFPAIFERIARRNGFLVESIHPLPHQDVHVCTTFWKRALSRSLSRMMRGNVWGDCNLFVLKPAA